MFDRMKPVRHSSIIAKPVYLFPFFLEQTANTILQLLLKGQVPLPIFS